MNGLNKPDYLKMPSIDDSWTQFSIFQAGEIAARVPLI